MTPHEKPHGLKLWWTILIVSASTSLFLNVWHALDPPEKDIFGKVIVEEVGKSAGQGADVAAIIGALIYGVIPVVMAALMSHGFTSELVGRRGRFVITSLFVVGMIMSFLAQAAVMMAYGGIIGALGIPILLDVSALQALSVINMAHSKAAAAKRRSVIEADIEARVAAVQADMEADMAARTAAIKADIEARAEADMAARLDAARADIEALAEADMSGRLAVAQADIREELEADMSARLAAIQEEAEAVMSARVAALRADMEADIRREIQADMAARAKTEAVTAPARRKALSAGTKAVAEGMTSMDRARALLRDNPDMTGADIGRALGMSERSGRRLRDDVLAEQADTGAAVTHWQADMEADMAVGSEADMADARTRLRAV